MKPKSTEFQKQDRTGRPMPCGWPFENVTSSKIARVQRLAGLANFSGHICRHLPNSNTHPLRKWDSNWDLFTHQLETFFGKQSWQEQRWPICVWSSSHFTGHNCFSGVADTQDPQVFSGCMPEFPASHRQGRGPQPVSPGRSFHSHSGSVCPF